MKSSYDDIRTAVILQSSRFVSLSRPQLVCFILLAFILSSLLSLTADLTDLKAETDIGQGNNSFQEKHPELRADQKALD